MINNDIYPYITVKHLQMSRLYHRINVGASLFIVGIHYRSLKFCLIHKEDNEIVEHCAIKEMINKSVTVIR